MVWYNSLSWAWACLYIFLSLHFWFSWVLLLKSVLRMRQPCTKQSNTNFAVPVAAFEKAWQVTTRQSRVSGIHVLVFIEFLPLMVWVGVKLSVSPLVRPVLVCGDHACPRASVQGVSHGAGGSVSLISNVRSIISNVTKMTECLCDVMIRTSPVATMCHGILSSGTEAVEYGVWIAA